MGVAEAALPQSYALGHCAPIFLAGTATGFVESFMKSKGISNITTWGKGVGGVIVVFVGIYLFYLGFTL
jgi:cytochrome c-type biogenesis protein